MDISEIINGIYPLPEDSIGKLIRHMKRLECARGCRIIEAGRVNGDLFFIGQGIARAYVPIDDRDITFWFGLEGDVIVSMKGYVCGHPGYEAVECVEDSVLYCLERSCLEQLFLSDINIANWGRRLAELELLQAEERHIPHLFSTAKERYGDFLRERPDLFSRISLEHLASYLGITPVSLSRIRSQLAKGAREAGASD